VLDLIRHVISRCASSFRVKEVKIIKISVENLKQDKRWCEEIYAWNVEAGLGVDFIE